LLLVGMDTGFGALARRLGPARWRTRPSAVQVIDWADVQAFGIGAEGSGEADGGTGRAGAVRLAGPREELRRLHPAELADLLEDLGRAERQELLGLVSPESAADALEEMQPDQLTELLTESDPAEAAELLARMESDEAADALRDLAADQRDGLLARLPKTARAAVERLLAKDEHTAGGLMTTMIVCVTGEQTVAQVRDRLAADVEHISDIDSVVVVSDDGRLLDDVTLGELLLATPDATVGSLVGPPWPVTVTPDADVAGIAARFVESRRLSIVVTDEDERPVGRILADDVVDMLLPERGRFRFPRVLS
jgi:Mg/Co/Ni transporter MgtE